MAAKDSLQPLDQFVDGLLRIGDQRAAGGNENVGTPGGDQPEARDQVRGAGRIAVIAARLRFRNRVLEGIEIVELAVAINQITGGGVAAAALFEQIRDGSGRVAGRVQDFDAQRAERENVTALDGAAFSNRACRDFGSGLGVVMEPGGFESAPKGGGVFEKLALLLRIDGDCAVTNGGGGRPRKVAPGMGQQDVAGRGGLA